MSNGKVHLKNVVAKQLPEYIRENYPTFVAFVEAYYDYLGQNSVDLSKTRDIDTTLESFLQYFKKEMAHNLPANLPNERFLLQHIKDQYLAKGSESSYRLLFRLLYGKEIYMEYPGKTMLRVSDGRWKQDVSLTVRVDAGDPSFIVGKIVDVQTSKKIYRTAVDQQTLKITKVTANVESYNVVDAESGIYEVFLDRNFYGQINPGDIIKLGSEFQALVLPVTTKLKIQNAGEGFKPGMVFQVSSGGGTPIWFKVTAVDDTDPSVKGKLKTIDVIKFGLGYDTDFSITILPSSAVRASKKIEQQLSTITYSKVTGNIGVINVIEGGSGYTHTPSVVIGGNGTGASAYAVLGTGDQEGQVVQIVVDSLGSGYTTGFANIVNDPLDTTGFGATTEVILGDKYSYVTNDDMDGFNELGYINYGDYWDVNESGRGAIINATLGTGLDADKVVSLTLVNGGSGYNLSQPTVDISIPMDDGVPIDGERARATVTVEDGVITEVTLTEQGSGYLQAPNVKVYGSYGYANGAYVGTIARQFYLDAKDTSSGNPALINVSLDALAKYPGYYKTNDGFLDDAMFIQDSYYYQAFSYVVRIDEQLSSYASAVRSMLHPSGMALFGEYSINNKFDLSIALEVMIKSLGISVYDTVLMGDTERTFVVTKGVDPEAIRMNEIIEPPKFVATKILEDAFAPDDEDPTRVFTKAVLGSQNTVVIQESQAREIGKAITLPYGPYTDLSPTGMNDRVITKVLYRVMEPETVVVTTDPNTSDVASLVTTKYVSGVAENISTPTESGYLKINPYEEGGYFLELYANEFASTF